MSYHSEDRRVDIIKTLDFVNNSARLCIKAHGEHPKTRVETGSNGTSSTLIQKDVSGHRSPLVDIIIVQP